MKKLLFITLVALTFNSSAQIKEGYYKSSEMIIVDYDSNGEVEGANEYGETTFLQINNSGIRLMTDITSIGTYYPWIFFRQDGKGYFHYATGGDAFKINLNKKEIVFYTNFNEKTGFYDLAIVYKNLEYVSKHGSWSGHFEYQPQSTE
tara:strand:+ start:928 stop:1371 length:444 start_codon:yes stop_codon:yes gene_type:complete